MSAEPQVVINPGSGTVAESSLAHAESAIETFIKDVGIESAVICERMPSLDVDGRYGFQLIYGENYCEVLMPGLPLDRVRWLDSGSGNIWDFPRLYVDGSSWIWSFALEAAHDSLTAVTE